VRELTEIDSQPSRRGHQGCPGLSARRRGQGQGECSVLPWWLPLKRGQLRLTFLRAAVLSMEDVTKLVEEAPPKLGKRGPYRKRNISDVDLIS
jgi:hypothetical protein